MSTIADGSIKIDIEIDGRPVTAASKELDKLEQSGMKSGQGVKAAEDGLKGVGNESTKAGSKVKQFATALGLVAIASKAFSVLKSSVDSAIARFDTLNAFPKVLQALGVSAEDSQKAMTKLSDGIDGLPTTLNDIASNAQRMYTSFNDMDKAADTALALNNAMLGSGASAADAQRGTEQYLQVLQKGKFEMEEWKTLQETMDVGLVKVAESLGFVGKTAKQDLYAALKEGEIPLEVFNDKLIELGTGTGELAELAKVNSLGIATSLSNLGNSAARGVAGMIQSFDKLTKEVTGKDIAQNIDSLKVVVNASFKVIGSVIEGAAPAVKVFASAVKGALPVVKALSPAIVGLVAAYASYSVVSKAAAAIEAAKGTIELAQTATKTLTVITAAQTTAQMAATGATQADIAAKLAQTSTISVNTAVIGLMTRQITLSQAAQIVAAAATHAWNVAIKLLMGPVGWITAGIGLLVAGIIAVVTWFKKTTEESERLQAETDELAASVNDLNNNIKSNADAHKESLVDIEASRKKNEELMQTVEELASKENKSAAEKQLLAGYINELNGSIDGLNLSYNEEANALNMSSEEIAKRLQLMAETGRLNEAMERQVEIIKEQYEVESKLDEITAKRKELKDAVADHTMTAKEAAEKIAELKEEEDALKVTDAELAAEHDRTMKIIAEATENGVNISVDALAEWMEKNDALLGNMSEVYAEILDITTNAFSKMSDKSKATGEEMIKNLKHNQKMMEEWSGNIAELYEYASKHGHEGFLHWLEKLGPDSAAEISAIKGMSDDQLKEFATLMDTGASSAAENFKTSLGKGMEDAFESVREFVVGSPKTLRESIKTAGFDEIGVDITDGLAGGVEAGTEKVEKATADMANKAIHATKEALDSNSPSKEFKRIGEGVPEGMHLGVRSGVNKVVEAVTKLAVDVLKPFDNTPSHFHEIGAASIGAKDEKSLAAARDLINWIKSGKRRRVCL